MSTISPGYSAASQLSSLINSVPGCAASAAASVDFPAAILPQRKCNEGVERVEGVEEEEVAVGEVAVEGAAVEEAAVEEAAVEEAAVEEAAVEEAAVEEAAVEEAAVEEAAGVEGVENVMKGSPFKKNRQQASQQKTRLLAGLCSDFPTRANPP
ncbi:hypothetical protein [Achromobacter kerstersii]|uniref:hypothetical protein n=1 Tax=Achromobacter kerstersii TaxID=1353890 RepID=UPI001FDF7F09|nr:hypothetical protein [Achromobacter kerstersii]